MQRPSGLESGRLARFGPVVLVRLVFAGRRRRTLLD
jgi:hypothetical protein